MSRALNTLHRLFEHPRVFNINQVILDGGKSQRIKQFLADVPYRSVVDIGCGTGNWAKLAGAEYLGIDTSPSFIAACQRRYGDDPQKTFVKADAADLQTDRTFDLAILISVLHHLSDEQAHRVLQWIARHARHFFVLDLYPNPRNPISKRLYAMDRGDFIRSPEDQRALIEAHPFDLVKADDYYSYNRLYRHTLFLYESGDGDFV